MLLNGAISGLAGITPASGYVSMQSSVVIGFMLGVISYWSLYLLKHKLKIDDALDVSSVHGITGAVGAFAIGICADKRVNDSGANGAIYGRPVLILIQLLAIVVVGIYSALCTIGLTIFVRRYMIANHDEQAQGLDQSEFVEVCYQFDEEDIHEIQLEAKRRHDIEEENNKLKRLMIEAGLAHNEMVLRSPHHQNHQHHQHHHHNLIHSLFHLNQSQDNNKSVIHSNSSASLLQNEDIEMVESPVSENLSAKYGGLF